MTVPCFARINIVSIEGQLSFLPLTCCQALQVCILMFSSLQAVSVGMEECCTGKLAL